MSLPTPYLPGETRHDIRNTRDGEYLFAPTPLMRNAFCFLIASLARRYNVGIVAFAMMCNHIHLLIVDLGNPDAPSDVPRFRSVFRSTFAQFVKWHWKRENGRIFCPDSVGDSINVIDFDSVEDAIAYIETNPISAGMEKSPEKMDGAVSQRKWLLTPHRVYRPEGFFQKRTWADYEDLSLVVPPIAKVHGFTKETFYEASSSALEKRMKEVLKERKRKGLKARPLRVLERLRPENGKGRSVADHTEAPIACSDPYMAAMAFERLRRFRRAHRIAMRRLREGHEDVVFPAGTYLASRVYGVRTQRPFLMAPVTQLE